MGLLDFLRLNKRAGAREYTRRENKRGRTNGKREYPIVPCFDYKSRWKRPKRGGGSRERTSVHVTQFVTSPHDTPRHAESGVRRYCFALCVDVRLYRQNSVMFTLAIRACTRGQYAVPAGWIAERRKCNFNDSDGPPQSHVATSQKCAPGPPSNPAPCFTGVSAFRRAPAISDANLHGPAGRVNRGSRKDCSVELIRHPASVHLNEADWMKRA